MDNWQYVGFIDFQPRFSIFLDSWMVGFLLCELHDFVLQYGTTICVVPLEINALMIGALPRWVDFYLFYLDLQEIIYDFKLSNVYLLDWTDYVGVLLCKLPVFTIWGITKFLGRLVLWKKISPCFLCILTLNIAPCLLRYDQIIVEEDFGHMKLASHW